MQQIKLMLLMQYYIVFTYGQIYEHKLFFKLYNLRHGYYIKLINNIIKSNT